MISMDYKIDSIDNNSLFLSQAYKDAWNDYNRSLNDKRYPVWDYVFLTASNDNQAMMFEKQIKKRKMYLPKKTRYIVIPDEKGLRVGSGGATLSVLKGIREYEKDFDKKKILVIHSGGDSKRIPQYSAIGKLFSPIPRLLEDDRSSTLFDELMIMTSGIPGRIKEGMLLLSGDVLLLFNPLMIDFGGKGALAISFKETVETGKNHGVFLSDDDKTVKAFLHKQSIDTLKKLNAVNDKGMVDIDTGAVFFGVDILDSLWSLISDKNKYNDKKYNSLVNDEVRLSLYGDFLYPLGKDASLEKYYKEKAEGSINDKLLDARKKVWEVLSGYNLKLLKMSPSKFIHFGTSHEYIRLVNEDIDKYSELDWSNQINCFMKHGSGYNSVCLSDSDNKYYLEESYIHEDVTIGNNTIISYMEIESGNVIPDDVVIHGIKLKNGKYVCRIFGINDNPKENKLFGKTIDNDLWNKELYPECDSTQEALSYALKLYELVTNNRIDEINKWHNKRSLCSSFNDADHDYIISWEKDMSDMVEISKIEKYIDENTSIYHITVNNKKLSKVQKKWLKNKLDKSSYSRKMRLYYYVGKIFNNEIISTKAFKCLSDTLTSNTDYTAVFNPVIKKDEVCVKLPLRVNFGGGWSDTPPYCNEHGGTVLNASILLNNEKPVIVTIRKIKERKIILESSDMDVYSEFDDIKSLQSVGDPFDPFVLQKASLLACGIIPFKSEKLDTVLDNLGSGFYMDTTVVGVPKGSGLGTSSILAAACVKALSEFFGLNYNLDEVYSIVLKMEQLMSTGGGWQDQVGGLSHGIKYITSKAGISQKINVEYVDVSENTMNELNERFALIYTGQRRLARNLLRDVVGRYIGNDKDTLYALKNIKSLAKKMKDELEDGDIDEFASLLSKHWELSKMIDSESTNNLIDQIFESIDDMIDGKMICGAGGGGFLQVILKKGVSKKELSDRLKSVFTDSDIDVWDCTITKGE